MIIPVLKIEAGSLILDTIKAIPRAIKEFSRQNINVIFEGATDDDIIKDMRQTLADISVTFIGITTPLEVAEKREKVRGGFEGLSRSQHRECIINNAKILCSIDPKGYDFTIDTSAMSPQEAAKKIYDFISSKKLAL